MAASSVAFVTNDGSRGPLVIITLLILNVIAVLLLCFRLLVRTKLKIGLGRDDLMIVLGWVRP